MYGMGVNDRQVNGVTLQLVLIFAFTILIEVVSHNLVKYHLFVCIFTKLTRSQNDKKKFSY
jgi:hypothetical protein